MTADTAVDADTGVGDTGVGDTGVGDTALLRVGVELDLATLPALRAQVQRALSSRPRTLVLDLSGCGFIGVDAVQALAALTIDADERGTALLLVGLRPSAWRVSRLLSLDSLLHTVPAPALRDPPA